MHMAVEPVRMDFNKDFTGVLTVEKGIIVIGDGEHGIQPYNLLLGALGSCFYSTFLDIIAKKRLTFDGATLVITGTKREEIPRTLNTVQVKMTIKNASNQTQFLRSVELGRQYCSVHETLSKVAVITFTVDFVA
jgi:putative redox protein